MFDVGMCGCTEQGALVRWDEMNWRSEQICSQEADGWNFWKKVCHLVDDFCLKRKAGAMSSKNSRGEAEQLRVEWSVAKCPALGAGAALAPKNSETLRELHRMQKFSISCLEQAKISPEDAFMAATMTALQKPDGGVRGIATGTTIRRLVAKTLARQFGKAVEATCVPYQFALSTRAGTDCVGHAIRSLTSEHTTMSTGAP